MRNNKYIIPYNAFIINELSGTEMVGQMGVAYGDTRNINNIQHTNVDVIYSEKDDKYYTSDDYYNLYVTYLKNGGTPIAYGYSKENIDMILNYLNNLKQ